MASSPVCKARIQAVGSIRHRIVGCSANAQHRCARVLSAVLSALALGIPVMIVHMVLGIINPAGAAAAKPGERPMPGKPPPYERTRSGSFVIPTPERVVASEQAGAG